MSYSAKWGGVSRTFPTLSEFNSLKSQVTTLQNNMPTKESVSIGGYSGYSITFPNIRYRVLLLTYTLGSGTITQEYWVYYTSAYTPRQDLSSYFTKIYSVVPVHTLKGAYWHACQYTDGDNKNTMMPSIWYYVAKQYSTSTESTTVTLQVTGVY